MAQNLKQNSFMLSETMSRAESKNFKSISSRGQMSNNNDNSVQWQSVSSDAQVSDNNIQWQSIASEAPSSSTHWNSMSSREGISNRKDAQISIKYKLPKESLIEKRETTEKYQRIRGFLKLLPFMPRFISGKQKNARKPTARFKSSSTLKEQDFRKLISLYRGYEVLYNPNHGDYGNKQLEAWCYANIASHFPKKTGQELQSQLNEQRQLFEQEYTVVENALRRFGQNIHPTIKYYNEFLFLVPFLDIKWDSGKCLPPSTTPEMRSKNSNTSNSTDPSRRSSDELELQYRITNLQTSSLGTVLRPSAGKNVLSTPLGTNQFIFCKRKPTKDLKKKDSDEIPTKKKLEQQPQESAGAVATQEAESPTQVSKLETEQDVLKNAQASKRLSKELEPVKQVESLTHVEWKDVQSAKRLPEEVQSPQRPIEELESLSTAGSMNSSTYKPDPLIARQARRLSEQLQSSNRPEESEPLAQSGSRYSSPPKRLSAQPEILIPRENGQAVSRRRSEGYQSPKRLETLSRSGSRNSSTSKRFFGQYLPSSSRRSSQSAQEYNKSRIVCHCQRDQKRDPEARSAQTLTKESPQESPVGPPRKCCPGNEEQLQMLCEMIRMELSSSPDYIYYDAKWRIIEILREVQKRNLIHNKSEPVTKTECSCSRREEAANAAPRNRIQCPMKATHCPYCCKR